MYVALTHVTKNILTKKQDTHHPNFNPIVAGTRLNLNPYIYLTNLIDIKDLLQ